MKAIKTGMNNKQMKSISMGNMQSMKGKKPMAVPGTKYKTASVSNESKANYAKENRDLDIKSKKAPANDHDADDRQMKKKSSIMIKPSRKGLLHEKLGVPQGQKIPEGKLNRALHSKSPSLRREANFARNFGHKK